MRRCFHFRRIQRGSFERESGEREKVGGSYLDVEMGEGMNGGLRGQVYMGK